MRGRDDSARATLRTMQPEMTPPVTDPSASSRGTLAYKSMPRTAPEMLPAGASCTKPAPLEGRRAIIVGSIYFSLGWAGRARALAPFCGGAN
jgi:hypothetical protein